MIWRSVLGCLVLATVGCQSSAPGAGAGDVIDAGADEGTPDLPASPSVSHVIDNDGDGAAVVGEWIGVAGQHLDGACSVRLGTAQARVIAVSSEEIQLQVPEGIPVGRQRPIIACDGGETSFELTVRRYHLVSMPAGHQVAVLEEASPGQISDTSMRLDVPDAEWLALSDDSAVAYVGTAASATAAPAIRVIDLTAAGGPALLPGEVSDNGSVRMPVFGLATAGDAPVLAVARGLHVTLYDISEPRRPVAVGAIRSVSIDTGGALPEIDAGFLTKVALGPDGTRAVVLDGAADQISVHDISTPSAPLVIHEGIVISDGSPVRPMVDLPIPLLSGALGLIKVRGGSAQALALSGDGQTAAVLAGGGLGALVPETYNLDLDNSTISVIDVRRGAHRVERLSLPEAHVPSDVAFMPDGAIYVTSMSSDSAVLLTILFKIGVGALVGGGLDLATVASTLLGSFTNVIDIAKAAWNGTLFHLGGLHHVVASASGIKVIDRKLGYVQGGLCVTYDGERMVAASQGWKVNIGFGVPRLVEHFDFAYELAATIHDPARTSQRELSLSTWQARMLLPPWSFGQAACQQ